MDGSFSCLSSLRQLTEIGDDRWREPLAVRYDSSSAQYVCFLRPLCPSKRLKNIASVLLSNVSPYDNNGIKMRSGKQLGRDQTTFEPINPPA